MKSEAEFDDITKALAQAHLKDMVRVFKDAFPRTFESIKDDTEAAGLREGFSQIIRECVAENDTEGLSLIAAWFVLHSPKPLLVRFNMFLEDETEGDDEQIEEQGSGPILPPELPPQEEQG